MSTAGGRMTYVTSFTPGRWIDTAGLSPQATVRALATLGATAEMFGAATVRPDAWWTGWKVPYRGCPHRHAVHVGLRCHGLLLVAGTLN